MPTMTAVRLHQPGSPDRLRVDQVDRPEPGEGQALIEVDAVGVNYADVLMARGVYPFPGDLPAVLGFEAAGTVRAVGPGADPGLVDRRVVALGQGGAYAAYLIADAATLVPVPDGIEPAVAAAFPLQGLTAHGMLQAARLAPGETVLVHAAAGGVGSLAVQIARLLGAGRVLATASAPAKRALATRLGADQAVDYTEPGWAQTLEAGSVDVVLDLVGGQVAADSLALLVPATGRMVLGGAAGGPPALEPLQLVGPAVSLVGFSLPPWFARPDFAPTALGRLLGWIADGALEVVVGQTRPLAEAGAALDAMARRETVGKTILLPHVA